LLRRLFVENVAVDTAPVCPFDWLTTRVTLVTNEQVVEVVEFETTAPTLRGEMTITYTLADADGGTDILAVHDGLPRALSTADNQRTAGRCPSRNSRRSSRRARTRIVCPFLAIINGGILARRRTATGR
jgi:hypothetical protein